MGWVPVPGVKVRRNTGTYLTKRDRLNLIEGTGVTLTVADDAGDEEVDVTIAASGGGGGGAMTLIEGKNPLASSASAITFSSIPNTFTSLLIRGRLRTDRSGNAGDSVTALVGNGSVDTGSNYTYNEIYVAGGTNRFGSGATAWERVGFVAAADFTAGGYAYFEMTITDYADTSQFRHFFANASFAFSANGFYTVSGGHWADTANEIDIVTFQPFFGSNFVAGSQLSLYGLA